MNVIECEERLVTLPRVLAGPFLQQMPANNTTETFISQFYNRAAWLVTYTNYNQARGL
jgi:hypothetical protein